MATYLRSYLHFTAYAVLAGVVFVILAFLLGLARAYRVYERYAEAETLQEAWLHRHDIGSQWQSPDERYRKIHYQIDNILYLPSGPPAVIYDTETGEQAGFTYDIEDDDAFQKRWSEIEWQEYEASY